MTFLVFSNRPRAINNNDDKDVSDDITDTMIMKGCYTSMIPAKKYCYRKGWTISSNAISSLDAFMRLVIKHKSKREAQTLLST